MLPNIASAYEKGISLGALAKSYGLAGLRMGWIACSDKKSLAEIAGNKHYLSICNSAPSEILSLIALRAKSQILERNLNIVRDNEQCLIEYMQRNTKLLSWTPPKGGCCGFVRLHARVDINELAERLVQQYGVLILPGAIFPSGTNESRLLVNQHFRVGLGRADFREALSIFEKALPIVLQEMGVDLSLFV